MDLEVQENNMSPDEKSIDLLTQNLLDENLEAQAQNSDDISRIQMQIDMAKVNEDVDLEWLMKAQNAIRSKKSRLRKLKLQYRKFKSTYLHKDFGIIFINVVNDYLMHEEFCMLYEKAKRLFDQQNIKANEE